MFLALLHQQRHLPSLKQLLKLYTVSLLSLLRCSHTCIAGCAVLSVAGTAPASDDYLPADPQCNLPSCTLSVCPSSHMHVPKLC